MRVGISAQIISNGTLRFAHNPKIAHLLPERIWPFSDWEVAGSILIHNSEKKMRAFETRILVVSTIIAILILGAWVTVSTLYSAPPEISVPPSEPSMSNFSGLEAEKREDREKASELILKQHQRLVQHLIELSDKPDPLEFSPYEWHNSKHLAILLLGDLRAVEAVHVLLEHLEYKNPRNIMGSYMDLGGYFPAAEALSKIGMSAVRPTIEKLGSYTKDSQGRRLCCWILKEILGVRLARVRLQIAIEESRDSAVKKNLTAALPYFKTDQERAAEERTRRKDADD